MNLYGAYQLYNLDSNYYLLLLYYLQQLQFLTLIIHEFYGYYTISSRRLATTLQTSRLLHYKFIKVCLIHCNPPMHTARTIDSF